MLAIEMERLTKSYDGTRNALDGVSLSIQEGGVFGFLGPNGSGKTTTVKLLCGLLAPSYGASRVLGIDPTIDALRVHQVSGLLTETAQMYDHLSAEQNLQFYGSLYGMERAELKARIAEMLSLVGLEPGNKRLKAYSTGMRKRLSMARVLLHRPRVLFLDEPTSGLDPESAQDMTDLIQTLSRDQGVTVFLCTHQLRYAQDICTQYGLISAGRLMATGTFPELVAGTHAQPRVRVHGRVPGERLRRVADGVYEADAEREAIPDLVRELVAAGADIYEVAPVQPTLEDVYFAYLGRRNGGASE